MSAIIHKGSVFEGSDAWNDAAVTVPSNTSDDRVFLVTTDVSGSITLEVFEQGSATAIYSTTMSAGSVIVNTPLPWDVNSSGRNFRHRISIATLTAALATLKGGRVYEFVYSIPTTNFGELRVVFEWTVLPLET